MIPGPISSEKNLIQALAKLSILIVPVPHCISKVRYELSCAPTRSLPASVLLPTCHCLIVADKDVDLIVKCHRFVYSIKALVNLQWLSSNPTHSETQQCVFNSISLSSSCSARLSWPRPSALLTPFYAQH